MAKLTKKQILEISINEVIFQLFDTGFSMTPEDIKEANKKADDATKEILKLIDSTKK